MNYISELVIFGNHDKNCDNDVDNVLHYSSGEVSPVWADFIDSINDNILETDLETDLEPELENELENELSNYLEKYDLEHNENLKEYLKNKNKSAIRETKIRFGKGVDAELKAINFLCDELKSKYFRGTLK